jgi:hypothetical protein
MPVFFAPCTMRYAPRIQGQLLLDGTMGRIGRMGRMIMGQGDNGTVLWGTMGLWDSTTYHVPRTTHYSLRTSPPALCYLHPAPFLAPCAGRSWRRSKTTRALFVCGYGVRQVAAVFRTRACSRSPECVFYHKRSNFSAFFKEFSVKWCRPSGAF